MVRQGTGGAAGPPADAGGAFGRLVAQARAALRSDRAAPAPAAEVDEPLNVDVTFVAYTEDCRVTGRVALEGDRLSDMLNARADLVLRDVLVESLVDGRSARADAVPVARDELVAVHADQPRGNPARRTRTIPYPVAVRSGTYLIRGYLHARPGTEPLASAYRRGPMIPLSNASIEYMAHGVARRVGADAIIVNRDTADWIQLVAEHDLRTAPAPSGEAALRGTATTARH